MLHGINDIGYNCTCSWKLTGALAIEHCIAKHISVHENTVEYAIDMPERMIAVDHELRYHRIDLAIIFPLACTKQLDACMQSLRIFDISLCDLRNSFCIDILIVYLLA